MTSSKKNNILDCVQVKCMPLCMLVYVLGQFSNNTQSYVFSNEVTAVRITVLWILSALPSLPMASANSATPTEQLLWKIVRAATALKSASDHWQQCQRRSVSLRRHVTRCCTVATALHKTSSCATTFGSAAKVVGGVATVVGVVSRVPSLTKLGSRMWRAGCAAKLAGLGARVLGEIWERGFKETLTAYITSVGGFLQSATLLRTALEEIEVLMPVDFTAERFMPLLLLVCPEEVFPYACHIARLFLGPENYSALYDFATMAMTSVNSTASAPLCVLYELESYHLLAVMESLPKPLQMASAALHVAKEVMDVAGGWKVLHNVDFRLIRKLLLNLRHVSLSLVNSVVEVPLLNSLTNQSIRP